MTEKITVERLDKALAKLAGIIEASGSDAYWPIFERLERERASLVGREERLKRAINRLQKDPDQTDERSS